MEIHPRYPQPKLVVSPSMFVAMRFSSSPSWLVVEVVVSMASSEAARVWAEAGLMAAGVTVATVAGGSSLKFSGLLTVKFLILETTDSAALWSS